MGIFDFLKKKQSAELTLEQLLEKSSSDPKYRPEFYKRLLEDNLVVITTGGQNEFNGVLEKDTTVDIVTFQGGEIPVFTSKDRIFDKGIIKEQVTYLQMQGKTIFELAVGAKFILNPYSDYGKELLPEEIKDMLDGTILKLQHNQVSIKEDTEILIGQPVKYPTELVEALKKLFSKEPEVKAAYIAWIHDPKTEDPPHYIFGIESDRDISEVSRKVGALGQQYLAGEIFDVVAVRKKYSLSDYFYNQCKPFYTR